MLRVRTLGDPMAIQKAWTVTTGSVKESWHEASRLIRVLSYRDPDARVKYKVTNGGFDLIWHSERDGITYRFEEI